MGDRAEQLVADQEGTPLPTSAVRVTQRPTETGFEDGEQTQALTADEKTALQAHIAGVLATTGSASRSRVAALLATIIGNEEPKEMKADEAA